MQNRWSVSQSFNSVQPEKITGLGLFLTHPQTKPKLSQIAHIFQNESPNNPVHCIHIVIINNSINDKFVACQLTVKFNNNYQYLQFCNNKDGNQYGMTWESKNIDNTTLKTLLDELNKFSFFSIEMQSIPSNFTAKL